MKERDIIRSRVAEKAKLRKAQRQMLKLFILTSSLIFITLVMIWLIQSTPETHIPEIYQLSNIIIILSSGLLFFGQKAIFKNDIQKALKLITMTLILGISFVITQYLGWSRLIDLNQQIRNIILPFTIIHFVHVVIGLLLLCFVLNQLRNYRIHSKESSLSTSVIYFWHFLGIVWLSFMGIMA